MTSYSALAEIFKQQIPAEDEAQLVIYVAGEKVVDTATGIDEDALVPIYSVSKALSALAVAHLVDAGKLELDQKVDNYWPEFAAEGKETVTVRQLLSHQAGLPDTRLGLTMEEILSDHRAAEKLAAEKPLWRPGTGFGYHAITIGTLINELFYRVTGESVQRYFETNVRKPSDADAYLGLPEELHSRVLFPLPAKTAPLPGNPLSLGTHVFKEFAAASNPSNKYSYLSSEGLSFGQPAAGGIASARGLAKVFNWATGYTSSNDVAHGGISAKTLEDMSQQQVHGYDLVLDVEQNAFGTIFIKPTSSKPFGGFQAYGHDGAAGAMVYADPSKNIVFGYTVRRFTTPGGFDPRLIPVVNKLYELAGAR